MKSALAGTIGAASMGLACIAGASMARADSSTIQACVGVFNQIPRDIITRTNAEALTQLATLDQCYKQISTSQGGQAGGAGFNGGGVSLLPFTGGIGFGSLGGGMHTSILDFFNPGGGANFTNTYNTLSGSEECKKQFSSITSSHLMALAAQTVPKETIKEFNESFRQCIKAPTNYGLSCWINAESPTEAPTINLSYQKTNPYGLSYISKAELLTIDPVTKKPATVDLVSGADFSDKLVTDEYYFSVKKVNPFIDETISIVIQDILGQGQTQFFPELGKFKVVSVASIVGIPAQHSCTVTIPRTNLSFANMIRALPFALSQFSSETVFGITSRFDNFAPHSQCAHPGSLCVNGSPIRNVYTKEVRPDGVDGLYSVELEYWSAKSTSVRLTIGTDQDATPTVFEVELGATPDATRADRRFQTVEIRKDVPLKGKKVMFAIEETRTLSGPPFLELNGLTFYKQ